MTELDDTQNLDSVPELAGDFDESTAEVLLDEVEDNRYYYFERSHPLQLWLNILPLLGTATFTLVVVSGLAMVLPLWARSEVIFQLFIACALLLLAVTTVLIVRELWKYNHWTLELNPEHNTITLYRPGNRKLFIVERNAQTIQIEQSAMTKNEKSRLEQYFFRRSSTVTIDNDVQDDVMFHDMHFVRDAERLRESIIWFNNLPRRENQAELETAMNTDANIEEIKQLLRILVKHLCPAQELP